MKVVVVLLLSLAALCLCEENVGSQLKEIVKAIKGFRGKRQTDTTVTCDDDTQRRFRGDEEAEECLTVLGSLEETEDRAAWRALCSCGDELYELYSECFANSGFAEFLDGLCATNEAGATCYDAIFVDYTGDSRSACVNASSNCSASCEAALVTDRDMLGCCLNSVVNTTVFTTTFNNESVLYPYELYSAELWTACGVDTPGFCTGAFSGGTALVISNLLAAIGLLTAVVCSF